MKPHVLIIDESLAVRLSIRDALESDGLTATHCEGISSAERNLRDTSFDLVVLSAGLTDGNPYEFLRSLRTRSRFLSLPVIVMGGESDVPSRVRATEDGASDYLCKQGDFLYLVKRARALLTGTDAIVKTTADAGPYRILVVDDSPTYLEAISQELSQHGHDTVIASSGQEGLRFLASQTVDCIVLDVFMPGLTGIETARMIKSWPAFAAVPIILLTGQADSVAKNSGQKMVADEFVLKSSVLKVLDARIRELIVRRFAKGRVRPAPISEKPVAEPEQRTPARTLPKTTASFALPERDSSKKR